MVLAVAVVIAGTTHNKIGFEAWDTQGQCQTAGSSREPSPETAMASDRNNQLISFSSDLNRVEPVPARPRRFPEGAREARIYVTSGALGKRGL